MESKENRENAHYEVYTNNFKAGKRTYFFDVKKSRTDEYYLTISENKKIVQDDGQVVYKKHKIFVYQNSLQDFLNIYQDVFDYIKKLNPDFFEQLSKKDDSSKSAEEDNLNI
ncbi:PUR family DNA/RNA-binding protein [Bacteroidales bacterium OttesenSCG-928-I21]|nr:PUR family DNA/RNA-binding protein [Bacteroidales bacterium OttesenSCG-928-I21]